MPRKIRPAKPTTGGRFRVERPQTPMTTESGDPYQDGAMWMTRIVKTLQTRHDSDNGDRHWVAYLRWYAGHQWLYEHTGKNDWELYSDTMKGIYTNNIVQSIGSGFAPFLLNGQITFKAKPQKPEDVNAAQLQTAILNYEWREQQMGEEVKKVIDDVVVVGHGICKIGYTVEVDEARRKGDGVIEYRDYVKKDSAFVERISPLDFIQDLSARDGTLKTARWCAQREYISLHDLMANKKYDKSVTDIIYSGGGSYTIATRSSYREIGRASDPLFGREYMGKVPEDHLIAVWTIWDKKYRRVITMVEGLPIPLLVEDWPYDYIETFPYVMIPFLRCSGLLYPVGVARQLKDCQLQLNRIRTQQVQNVRAQKNMVGALKGQIDKEALEDFADLPALSVIMMEREGALFAIPNPPMNKDMLILEQSIAKDAQAQTGADALFQGQNLPDRTTAGEVAARTNILRLKADDKVSNVEKGVVDIARQVLAHLKANRVESNVIEIVGLLGSEWRQYTSDEIQAETDVEVSYFSAPKYDPAVERQQRLQIMQLATQALPVMQQTGAQGTIDMVQLFAWVLDSFDDVKDAGRFFKEALTVPAPLQEQQAGQPPMLPPAPMPNAGQGLPPALAGGLAPAQLPQQPNAPQPGGGLSIQDLQQLVRGQGGLTQ